jgi:hypothetical protein
MLDARDGIEIGGQAMVQMLWTSLAASCRTSC